MSRIRPSRREGRWNPRTAAAFAILCALAVFLVAGGHLDSAGGLIAAMWALMALAWMLFASVLSVVCSGGLICEPPGITEDFHALSRFPLDIALANTSRLLPCLFLQLDFELETGGHILTAPPRFVGALRPRQAVRFGWEVTARRRGDYSLRNITARIRFPGSLVTEIVAFYVGRRFVALPAVYRLRARMNMLLQGRRGRAGATARQEEFMGVRPYRPGDSPRLIHRALSLRTPGYPTNLVVKEFEPEDADPVTVILDNAIAPDDPAAAALPYRLEKAISFAAAVCRWFVVQRHPVRFLAGQRDGAIDLAIHRAEDVGRELELRLAQMGPAADGGGVARLLANELRRPVGPIVLIALHEPNEAAYGHHAALVVLGPSRQMGEVAEVLT